MIRDPGPRARKAHLPPTFVAFRARSFRFLWPSNLLSHTCRWMQITLLSWLVLIATDSAWQVALVGFFSSAPMMVLGLVGGALADTADRRTLLLASQTTAFAAALAMTVLLGLGREEAWHAFVVVMVIGVTWALDMPSRRSAIHDIVGRSGVTNGVALDSVGMSLSKMLGPPLAGGLIAIVGVGGGYVVVTAFYFVSIVLIWSMKLTRESGRVTRSAGVTSGLLDGLRYVAGNRTLLATVMITVLMNLLLFPYMTMVPVIARNVLKVGPALMGALQGFAGAGALIGAVSIASVATLRYHGRVYVGGSLIAMFALFLFAVSKSYALSAPVLLVLGVGTAGFSTMQAALVMLVAREEMRGKALGVVSLGIGTGPLGSLGVGALAGWRSPGFALGLNAVVGLVALAIVFVFMPSLRRETIAGEQATGACQDR